MNIHFYTFYIYYKQIHFIFLLRVLQQYDTKNNPYCKSLQPVIESHLRPCVERGSLGKMISISAHNDGFIFIEFLIHQEMIQIVT